MGGKHVKQNKAKNKLSVRLFAVFVSMVVVVLSTLVIHHFALHPINRNFTEESQHNIGRFTIPAVDIDVGLYEFELVTQEDADEMKNAMDEDDVAVKFWGSSKGGWFIGDHNYQGFGTLKKCEVGDIAYIDLKDGTQQKYQVVEKFIGENSGTELTKNGEPIAGNNSDGIIVYTCGSVWNQGEVWIAFLQPVNS